MDKDLVMEPMWRKPSEDQLGEVFRLESVRYAIGTYTAHNPAVVLIPKSWNWQFTADDPDPNGTVQAQVMGYRCIPADVPVPMLAYAAS